MALEGDVVVALRALVDAHGLSLVGAGSAAAAVRGGAPEEEDMGETVLGVMERGAGWRWGAREGEAWGRGGGEDAPVDRHTIVG